MVGFLILRRSWHWHSVQATASSSAPPALLIMSLLTQDELRGNLTVSRTRVSLWTPATSLNNDSLVIQHRSPFVIRWLLKLKPEMHRFLKVRLSLNGEVELSGLRMVLSMEVPMQAGGGTTSYVLTLSASSQLEDVDVCSSPYVWPHLFMGYSYNLKENPYDYHHIHHHISSSFRIVFVHRMGGLFVLPPSQFHLGRESSNTLCFCFCCIFCVFCFHGLFGHIVVLTGCQHLRHQNGPLLFFPFFWERDQFGHLYRKHLLSAFLLTYLIVVSSLLAAF